MRKVISAALASLVLASAMTVPARAEQDNQNFVYQFCSTSPNNPNCRSWTGGNDQGGAYNLNRGGWYQGRNGYHSWNQPRYYPRERYYHRDRGNDAAAAVFGFIAGAAAGAIAGNVGSTHRERCEDHYRSYDWRTDTFLGYDGQRHYCRL